MPIEQQVKISDWTWSKAVKLAHDRLESRGLSKLSQPEYDYQDIGNIEQIESVGDQALANMLTRHLAWYSYATVELSDLKSSLTSLTELFEVELGEEMNNVAKTQDSKVVKDVLKGIAIQKNDKLTAMFRKRVELIQEINLLEGMVNGYLFVLRLVKRRPYGERLLEKLRVVGILRQLSLDKLPHYMI